jgi:hypothetical protein
MRHLRKRWPLAEYACLLEFTTGYGPLSGGRRRPHWNLLLKGIPLDDLDEARALIVEVWCRNVDAKPAGQHVGPVREAGGLMRYLALHFQKESQSPPAGFRGQRFNCSRGYFTSMTRAEARVEAKAALWDKRQLHRALELGLVGDEAEDFVDAAYLAADGVEWRLYSEPKPADAPEQRDRRPAGVPWFVAQAAWQWLDIFSRDSRPRPGARSERLRL